MTRKIGPVPLVGGLQLEPPEGKPHGLLRGLNVEGRDGHLAVRRGAEAIGTLNTNQGALASVYPAIGAQWDNQTVGYFGLITPYAVNAEDESILFGITNLTIGATGTEGDAPLTWEFYGEDDEWHELDVLLFSSFPAAVFGSVRLPRGWKLGTPTGIPALANNRYWMRLTVGGGFAFTPAGALPQFTHTQERAIQSDTLLYVFTSRRGPRCVACIAREFSGATDFRAWHVYDVDQPNESNEAGFKYVFNPLLDEDAVPRANVGDRAAALYVPATDEVLFSLGDKLYTWSLAADPEAAPDAQYALHPASALEVFAPDHGDDVVDTRFEDVVVETHLTAAKVLAIHAGRVFAMAFPGDPHTMRWSAPDEFWHVFPSSNVATLATKSSGMIVGAIEVQGTLFIFTTTSIFKAQISDTPTGTNESDLYLDQVEETGCVSGRTIVAVDGRVLFLSSDGVRVFDGVRSRTITKDVRDLFRPGSRHAMAVRQYLDEICAVWHPIENEYRLFYSTSGARENDALLTIRLDDMTCWLHGSEDVAGIDTQGVDQPVGQRRRGVRAHSAVWHPARGEVVTVDKAGVVGVMDCGDVDMESKIEAYAETHHIGMGDARDKVLTRVDLMAARDHFSSFTVGVIPDGNRAREDSRVIDISPFDVDSLDAGAEDALLPQAGRPLVELDDAYAPITLRMKLKGRNHRIRIATRASDHAPFRISSMEVELEIGGKR
jgi:hypothetical protein